MKLVGARYAPGREGRRPQSDRQRRHRPSPPCRSPLPDCTSPHVRRRTKPSRCSSAWAPTQPARRGGLDAAASRGAAPPLDLPRHVRRVRVRGLERAGCADQGAAVGAGADTIVRLPQTAPSGSSGKEGQLKKGQVIDMAVQHIELLNDRITALEGGRDVSVGTPTPPHTFEWPAKKQSK